MLFTDFFLLATHAAQPHLHFGSARDVRRWAVSIPWLFAAMLATSMLALEHASMGAFVVMRNVTPFIALACETAVTGEKIGATPLK